MKTHRINVLGASGSGASTVGRALSAALSVPYFDSDDYFHEPGDPPYGSPRSPQVRHSLVMADLDRAKSWVLSGGVAGWVPYPQLDFTLIVFLGVPTPIRIERLRRRERERFDSLPDRSAGTARARYGVPRSNPSASNAAAPTMGLPANSRNPARMTAGDAMPMRSKCSRAGP